MSKNPEGTITVKFLSQSPEQQAQELCAKLLGWLEVGFEGGCMLDPFRCTGINPETQVHEKTPELTPKLVAKCEMIMCKKYKLQYYLALFVHIEDGELTSQCGVNYFKKGETRFGRKPTISVEESDILVARWTALLAVNSLMKSEKRVKTTNTTRTGEDLIGVHDGEESIF